MKSLISTIFLLSFCCFARGQACIEIQAAGSNFLGVSINSAYEIRPFQDRKFAIIPFFGIGTMAMPDDPAAIIHGGIDQRYGKWGLGIEVSGFFENPFVPQFDDFNFIDLLTYPNISYLKDLKNNFYIKYSIGAYIAFSKGLNRLGVAATMQYEPPVIPGLGITLGYRLN